MGFNTPRGNSENNGLNTSIVNQIHVDGVNNKGLPTGYSPSVVYRVGDGTVHPDGWDNVIGNEYLDFYMPSYFGNAEAEDIRTVAENIIPVVAAGTNIGAIVALTDNYSDIVNANANVETGITNVINITPNTVGVSTTIASGNNAVSFGTINIPSGVEVTIENDAEWLIIG